MQYYDLNEKKSHGTPDFPFEYYYVDRSHPRYVMNYHWHLELEMIRVLSGSLAVTLDDRHLLLEPGALVFVNGGVLHAGEPEGCVYECLVFDPQSFARINPVCADYMSRIKDHLFRVNDYISSEHNHIHQIADRVFRSIAGGLPGYELATAGGLLEFFGHIFMERLYSDRNPSTIKRRQRIWHLRNAIDYINMHYGSAITLAELAKTANMSPKYFCRYFSQITHRTPIDYLNSQRVEHACLELATTNDSVTEVALNCGFSDLSYFIKTFRRYKGVTPKKYAENSGAPESREILPGRAVEN